MSLSLDGNSQHLPLHSTVHWLDAFMNGPLSIGDEWLRGFRTSIAQNVFWDQRKRCERPLTIRWALPRSMKMISTLTKDVVEAQNALGLTLTAPR